MADFRVPRLPPPKFPATIREKRDKVYLRGLLESQKTTPGLRICISTKLRLTVNRSRHFERIMALNRNERPTYK